MNLRKFPQIVRAMVALAQLKEILKNDYKEVNKYLMEMLSLCNTLPPPPVYKPIKSSDELIQGVRKKKQTPLLYIFINIDYLGTYVVE